jgi:hypothetical protein
MAYPLSRIEVVDLFIYMTMCIGLKRATGEVVVCAGSARKSERVCETYHFQPLPVETDDWPLLDLGLSFFVFTPN